MKTKTVKKNVMVRQEVEEVLFIANDESEWENEDLANARNDLLKKTEEYKFQEVYFDGGLKYIGYFDSYSSMRLFLNAKFRYLGSVSKERVQDAYPMWAMIDVDDNSDYTYTTILSYEEIIESINEAQKEIDDIKKIIG